MSIFTTWNVSSYLIIMYCSYNLIIVVLISKFASCTTIFLNLLQGLSDLCYFNNDIMSSQAVVDVAGENKCDGKW
jgi:hypothetical protein